MTTDVAMSASNLGGTTVGLCNAGRSGLRMSVGYLQASMLSKEICQRVEFITWDTSTVRGQVPVVGKDTMYVVVQTKMQELLADQEVTVICLILSESVTHRELMRRDAIKRVGDQWYIEFVSQTAEHL